MELLKKLCSIRATSGDESAMTDFMLDYISRHSKDWKTKPEVLHGDGFQDAIILVFGKPRTAIFAHMDNIGYAVSYKKNLVRIGGPSGESGWKLVGSDSKGEIECSLKVKWLWESGNKKEELKYRFNRTIDRGTPLSFKENFRESDKTVQSPYLDNRLGVWNALQVAKNLENGIIVLSTYEEVGGGSVQFLGKYIQDKYGVKQALISDITLATEAIKPKNGVAISMRDKGVPRQSYLRKIIALAKKNSINYQLEVEDAGGSDGTVLQYSSGVWDWCFIGPPEKNYHTPNEKAWKVDIQAMNDLYAILMDQL
jgi:putative aminopeptidase FrvX